MRSRLPQSPLTSQAVGFSVNTFDFKLKKLSLVSTPFWTFAKKCMKATTKGLANKDLCFTTHFLDDMMRDERKFDQLSQLYPDGLMSELFLSNIGKYPYSCDYNQGQLQLRGLHVINNCSVFYSTATFFVTCAGDGQLDFSLGHVIESKEKALEFLNYYVRLVETSANADNDMTLDQLLSIVN